jgi:hypothetical protein
MVYRNQRGASRCTSAVPWHSRTTSAPNCSTCPYRKCIVPDLLTLARHPCWRIVSAERSALLPSGIINTIVTRSIGLALTGPFCVDPAGRRGFRDPQATFLWNVCGVPRGWRPAFTENSMMDASFVVLALGAFLLLLLAGGIALGLVIVLRPGRRRSYSPDDGPSPLERA